MRLYVMAMAYDVRSPTPHVYGPPGCGKSTMAQQLADLVHKKLHIINVSRLSPLEVEGVQMPVDENTALHMIPAAFWSRLQDGDIILLDEFLRGFPEVYNALLDILTSRRAGDFELPRVFIMAASNSVTTYDKALEDRLVHLTVPDPRKSKGEKKRLATMLVDALGLLPEMDKSYEMATLLDTEVLPMFDMLDSIGKSNGQVAASKGQSLRKLIGLAQLREFGQSAALKELIVMNNNKAMQTGKIQYVFLPDGLSATPVYITKAKQLAQQKDKLTEVQARNLDLNLQLIELEVIRNQKEGSTTDEPDINDIFS